MSDTFNHPRTLTPGLPVHGCCTSQFVAPGVALSHVTLQTRDAFYEWSQLVQVYAGPRLKLWPSWRKVRDSLETAVLFLSPFYGCTQLRYWLLPALLRAIPHCFSKRFRESDSCNIYVSSQRHPWFASDNFKRHLRGNGRENEWLEEAFHLARAAS